MGVKLKLKLEANKWLNWENHVNTSFIFHHSGKHPFEPFCLYINLVVRFLCGDALLCL